MTTALKLRRGTTTQHNTFTGAAGEVTVDTTKKTVVVHDGATAGGSPLAKESRTINTSGGITGGGDLSADRTLTLTDTGVTAGTYGGSSAIPVLVVDAKGRITGMTTAVVAGGQYFGTATVKAIAYNSNTISENVTITAGNNGLSAAPISIASGYTVTVETGANWTIV